MNSRAKGKRGELEAAKALSEVLRVGVERTVQYSGAAGHADLKIEALPMLHVEVKRRRKPITPDPVQDFMDQAQGDLERAQKEAGGDRVAIVMHRSDGDKDWLITLRNQDLYAFVAMLSQHEAWRR